MTLIFSVMKNDTPQISIVVPSMLGEQTIKTFDSISTSTEGLNVEVIVVNDNKEALPPYQKYSNFVFINNPKSGVASARNFGAKKASSELLLFIDDDMIITKESILHAIHFPVEHKEATLNIEWEYPEFLISRIKQNNFGRYLIKNGFTSMRGWASEWSWKDDSVFDIDRGASYFLLISKKTFEEVGGYNEHFPFAGFEDHDFCQRVVDSGIQSYVSTKLKIYHNEETKVDIDSWMVRKLNGSKTRKIAVNLGYKELELHYSFIKKLIFNMMKPAYKPYLWFLKKFPSFRWFDGLFFKLVNIALALSIYIGYTIKND